MMENLNFETVLKAAVSGDMAAIEKILKIYDPLITNSSIIKGEIDEDLKQEIVLHILKNISKFSV